MFFLLIYVGSRLFLSVWTRGQLFHALGFNPMLGSLSSCSEFPSFGHWRRFQVASFGGCYLSRLVFLSPFRALIAGPPRTLICPRHIVCFLCSSSRMNQLGKWAKATGNQDLGAEGARRGWGVPAAGRSRAELGKGVCLISWDVRGCLFLSGPLCMCVNTDVRASAVSDSELDLQADSRLPLWLISNLHR